MKRIFDCTAVLATLFLLLLLRQYFEDILYRDVVSRNEIRDVVTMKNLVVYLLTNTGRLTSISSLKRVFGVSQDKIENYTAAIMETYLVHRLPKFSFSMKKSLRDRFKVYAIDTGLRNRVAFSFSGDSGWLAEKESGAWATPKSPAFPCPFSSSGQSPIYFR